MSTQQDDIDQSEWENPDNWSTIYFSKRDSRATVPKKNPKHGWTINFGHSRGAKWIYYLMCLFFIIGIIVGVGVGVALDLLETAQFWKKTVGEFGLR